MVNQANFAKTFQHASSPVSTIQHCECRSEQGALGCQAQGLQQVRCATSCSRSGASQPWRCSGHNRQPLARAALTGLPQSAQSVGDSVQLNTRLHSNVLFQFQFNSNVPAHFSALLLAFLSACASFAVSFQKWRGGISRTVCRATTVAVKSVAAVFTAACIARFVVARAV